MRTTTEYVAVVGSRQGASEDSVRHFLSVLYAKHPDVIVVSGGADGVDKIAESHWLGLGGRVLSYRPTAWEFETLPGGKRHVTKWVIEEWRLGGAEPNVTMLLDHPSFADYASACLYRDTLINEKADRLLSFQRAGGSRGASFTMEWREDVDDKPRYRYVG